jgi:hypothetical protein
MTRLGGWLVGFFFLLMLVVPTTLQAQRGILLALLLIGTILILIKSPDRWSVSKPLVYWLVACVTYSVFSMLVGVLNGAQGAIAVSTVYVLWPILYVYFIGFAKTIEGYVFLVKVLLIGVFLAAMSGVLLVASSFYPALGILDPYFELMEGGLGLKGNTIAFNLDNMASVIYGLAFLSALLLLSMRTSLHFSRKWKAFCIVSLFVSFFVMLISGRKGFIVVGLISAPLSLILMHMTGIHSLQLKFIIKILASVSFIIIFALLIGSLTLGLDLSAIVDNFFSGFDFGDASNVSAARRAEQFNALIGEWQSSPLIGFGHGSGAISAPGDMDPWAYELQYVALLFQTGILGMLVYGSAVAWLMYQMVRLSRKYADLAALMLPALVGLTCFLIANATNPYLMKFDYLWTLFLPVGLVNIGLLRDNTMRCSSKGFLVNA